MARKRMIDPAFFLDEDISKLSPHARLLYIGTWTLADDVHFTLPNRPEWIRAQIFPYEEVDISSLIKELEDFKKLLGFTNGDGKAYLFIPTMAKHQVINRPSEPKYPPHPEKNKYLEGQVVLTSYSGTQGVLTPNISKYNISKVYFRTEDGVDVNDEYIEKVLRYMNEVSGSKFSVKNPSHKKHVLARIKEGAVHKDFELVVDHMWEKWKGTQWESFFRPSTLFNSEKFDGYLAEAKKGDKR